MLGTLMSWLHWLHNRGANVPVTKKDWVVLSVFTSFVTAVLCVMNFLVTTTFDVAPPIGIGLLGYLGVLHLLCMFVAIKLR